jgi:beta-glucosidase
MRAGTLESDAVPAVRDGDLEEIATPVDFLGVNYYSRLVVEAAPNGHPAGVKQCRDEALTDMGWEVYPDGLEHTLVRLHSEYAPPAIYIAENGAAYDDSADESGRIADHRRISYLREHTFAAQRAIARGVPLKGYFVWSLMDNFEWAHGYRKKFGLYAISPETRERIPRDSVAWFRSLVCSNKVVREATA